MTYSVGIAGIGAIGMRVARALDGGEIPGMRLVAVSAGDLHRAAERVADFAIPPHVVAAQDLAAKADIVIESAPKSIFEPLARSAVEGGRIFMPLSVGALLDHPNLVERAAETGAQIVVPTGALLGLDTVRAMAVGEIHHATLTTRKPPGGLAGAPYLEEQGIDLAGISEPVRVFAGTAREAARGFPANVNVAAALSLAGIGSERTMVEVWADPGIDRNIQSVSIASDAGEAEMVMRNIPSAENPRTGRITAQSVIACLKRLTDRMVVGS
ncbi:MAG: aspartate dehydrogenase [Pseudomonadota bacterium]